MDDVTSECSECEADTLHEIIKRTEKGRGEDVLIRCSECSKVHTVMLRPPKIIIVKTTLSDGRESRNEEIEVDEDEEISRGDVFEHDGNYWTVTRLDDPSSRSQESLYASKIRSMWATRSDKTVVGITMTDGEFSESSKLDCEPERVFSCGSIISVAGNKWRIRAIHTGKGRTLTGSRYAHEIRRVYLHLPDKTYDT